ncbi:MAG: hypothetical protein K5650_06035 [Bacteroidales bacterium]|nr:hypothetical protein [Bacteroidales bacterium]
MRRFWLIMLAMLALMPPAFGQGSGLYVPTDKPVKNMRRALTNPEVFCLLIQFKPADTTLTVADLDLLDSAYNIAFSLDNPKLYTMRIEGYGTADTVKTATRVEAVERYFAMRSHAPFSVRYARNPIRCSCHGDSVEVLRYEVPTIKEVYNCAQLPPSRLLLNKSVPLQNTVLVTFRNNPDECIGSARGCYIPTQDSTVHGYYTSLMFKRGSVYSVENTKDSCPTGFEVRIDDHLDSRQIVERYFLIPHRKQILVMAGYTVLSSNMNRKAGECEQPLPDSIYVRFPVTKEQFDSKLRIFARVPTSRGPEYKALPTRKVPQKTGGITIEAAINASQFDTIFLGKKIDPKELTKYFYEVPTDTEAGTVTVGGKYYKAYRPGKNGGYDIKKPLKAMLRIVPDQEEEIDTHPVENPDEVIDED